MYDKESVRAGAAASVAVRGGPVVVQCFGPDGALKWEVVEPKNLVVNVGLNWLLDVLLRGSAAVATWYVGLVATGETIASADTMSAHAGWTELTGYTGNRAEYVDARTNQTVSNTASAATFAINTAQSVAGALITSDATKGSSAGTLLCAVAFTGGDRAASDGDTINVTYTFSAADS